MPFLRTGKTDIFHNTLPTVSVQYIFTKESNEQKKLFYIITSRAKINNSAIKWSRVIQNYLVCCSTSLSIERGCPQHAYSCPVFSAQLPSYFIHVSGSVIFILWTIFTDLEIFYANVNYFENTKIALRTTLRKNSLLAIFLEVMKYMC